MNIVLYGDLSSEHVDKWQRICSEFALLNFNVCDKSTKWLKKKKGTIGYSDVNTGKKKKIIDWCSQSEWLHAR